MFNKRNTRGNALFDSLKNGRRRKRNYIMNESFSGNDPVLAIINIAPNTYLDVNPGEELTEDMITDPDDMPVVKLISLADTVTVDDITGDNSYKLAVSVSEPESAARLYNWITTYTNTKNDDDIETYVAPGLIDLMNSSETNDIEDIEDPDMDDDLDALADETDAYNESVSSRFSKYRNLYESAVDSLNEKDDDKDSSDDDFADLFGDDNDDAKDNDSAPDDKKSDDDENSDDKSDDTEDVPMTAIVITVKRDDIDKCKDEMVSAGIPEEDIEVLDNDDDDENGKLKIDANSVKELKDYLAGKGIDLEEKIGGEIIDDEDSDKDSDDKDSDKDDDSEEPTDDFNMNDLFGDDESDADDDNESK